jgi:Anaphase promoting complex subunit 8 / Cdc23
MKKPKHASPFLTPLTPIDPSSGMRRFEETRTQQVRDAAASAARGVISSERVVAPWDASMACVDLQRAAQILSERCLKLAAKWAVEQWLGLPPEIIEGSGGTHILTFPPPSASLSSTKQPPMLSPEMPSSTIPDDLLWGAEERQDPVLNYARTLFELGEYAHAAARLSETSLTNKAASVETMPPPLEDLSPKAIYIRAYALYMAGERRKEEDLLDQQRYSHLLFSILCITEYSTYHLSRLTAQSLVARATRMPIAAIRTCSNSRWNCCRPTKRETWMRLACTCTAWSCRPVDRPWFSLRTLRRRKPY